MCDNRLGGLLGFRGDVIKHFMDNGHEVVLLAPKAESEWDKVGVKIEGVKIINIPISPNATNPIGDSKLFFFLLKLYRKEKPDVVFNYTIKPNIYSCIAAKLAGAKVVDMLAGLGYIFSGRGITHRIGRLLYRFGLSVADKVLVLNEDNKRELLSRDFVSSSKLLRMKCGEGVNLNHYPFSLCDYSGGVCFLMISRLLYDKGYDEYIKACSMVKEKYPNANVTFELLGPTVYNSPMGVEEERLNSDIKEGIVKYLGVSNEVPSIIGRKNTVVVVPSKYKEGLNRSLIEACSIGRPVITTDMPGCVETVDDGVNGFVVPKGDVNALTDAMIRFIQLPEDKRKQMAEASRKKAEACFDIKYVLEMYDSLLK